MKIESRRTLVWASLVCIAYPALAKAQGTSIETIVAAHEAMYRSLQTIRIDSVEKMSPLVAAEELYALEHRYEFASAKRQVVIASDGRTFVKESREIHAMPDISDWWTKKGRRGDATLELTYREIQQALPYVKPKTSLIASMFDGKRIVEDRGSSLAQLGVEREAILVIDVARLQSAYLPLVPLHLALVSFRCPGFPRADESRQRSRLPDLLKQRDFHVIAEAEEIAGLSCILVEATGQNRIWVAPSLNFAVRRHQRLQDGATVWDMTADGFKEILDGVWLPTKLSATTSGWKGIHPDRYLGVPLYRVDYEFGKVEVNSPSHEQFFEFNPDAGTLILDETLLPSEEYKDALGRDVRGVVSYVMPADERELDAVIRRAVTDETRSRRGPWFIVGFVVANLVLLAAVVIFLSRRRHHPTTEA